MKLALTGQRNGRPGRRFPFARACFALGLALLGSATMLCAEPLLPFSTLAPITLPEGELHLRVGASLNLGERPLFARNNHQRRAYELPVLLLTTGIAPKVELTLTYPLILLDRADQGSNYGSGDLQIDSLFTLRQESSRGPTTALHLSAKLPNADDLSGFGTDETDFFAGLALEKSGFGIRTVANLDFAILGNPNAKSTIQDDVLVFALALLRPLTATTRVGLEWSGIAASRFGNNRQQLLVGLVWHGRGWQLDLGAGRGLSHHATDLLLRTGLTLAFGSRISHPLPVCPPCPASFPFPFASDPPGTNTCF